jgi:hypothetical protein
MELAGPESASSWVRSRQAAAAFGARNCIRGDKLTSRCRPGGHARKGSGRALQAGSPGESELIRGLGQNEGSTVGITDRLTDLRKKAEETAGEHTDRIQQAVEKAGAAADRRTKGRYHEQITKAGAKVGEYVEGLEPRDKQAEEGASSQHGPSQAPPAGGSDPR